MDLTDNDLADLTDAITPWPAVEGELMPETDGCEPPTHWDTSTLPRPRGSSLRIIRLHALAAARNLDLADPSDLGTALHRVNLEIRTNSANGINTIVIIRALIVAGVKVPYKTNGLVFREMSDFVFLGIGRPIFKFRDPTITELADQNENGKDAIKFEDCHYFRIRNIGIDGNRDAWPNACYESSTTSGGFTSYKPLGAHNLVIENCTHFNIAHAHSRGSRGNDLYLIPADFLDPQTFPKYGHFKGCSFSYAVDSSVVISACRGIRFSRCKFEFPNGGQTCAGLQLEGKTYATVGGQVDYTTIRQASPGWSDVVVTDSTFIGCYRGVHVNGRWGSGRLTIRKNKFYGGAAEDTQEIALPADECTDIPLGKLPYSVQRLGMDQVETNNFMPYGGVVGGCAQMTIAKNEFFRFDNNYYKMSAVISIRSGFADCVFIVGNSFWCIHNRRIWPAPSSSPFPSGNRDTDISLFRALIPVILDKHASGRVVVAYNLFGPSERWYPGNPLAKSCSGIGGFLVYSSRPINGPTPARTYLKNFQLWPNKPGIVSPPSAGLWSLKLLKHKNDSLIEP